MIGHLAPMMSGGKKTHLLLQKYIPDIPRPDASPPNAFPPSRRFPFPPDARHLSSRCVLASTDASPPLDVSPPRPPDVSPPPGVPPLLDVVWDRL